MNFLNNVLMMIFGIIGRIGKFAIYIVSKVAEMIVGVGTDVGKEAKNKISNRFQQAVEDADESNNGPLR